MSVPESPLRIIIVGAGICGLATASALRSDGHHVVILEKSKTNSEIGAAMALGPNAVHILDRWGFDMQRARGVPTAGFEVRNAETGDLALSIIDDWPVRFGKPWIAHHRVDLHNELKLMATGTGVSDTKPATLRTGVNIIDLDAEKGSVTLDDGEVIYGDIIVGADGMNSYVRSKVLSTPREAVPTGHAMYRVLIPAEVIENDPLLKESYSDTPRHRVWTKKNRFLITYWCRNKEFLNLAAMVPAASPRVAATGWEGVGDPSELREFFGDFVQPVPRLLEHVTSSGLWGLRDLDPLETWVAGRTILLGEAAHPMLPLQAHGAGIGIEDAEALQVALSSLTSSPSDVSHINSLLKQVQAVRYDRATLVQLRSRAAAGYYFHILTAAETLKNLGTVSPTEGMAQIFRYTGARDWAREKGMDLPAFQ